MPIEHRCSKTIVKAVSEIADKAGELAIAEHECRTHGDVDFCRMRGELNSELTKLLEDFEEDILEACR